MEFLKKKNPIMGSKGAEVVFMQVAEGDDKPFPPFAFVATSQGVRWEGKTTQIKDMNDLQDMARVASEAWAEHLKLKPRIEVTAELPAPPPEQADA